MLFPELSMSGCNINGDVVKGRITAIESFGSVDGPGVRFIAFLAGCPLRCLYCHNPETWQKTAGKEITSTELFKQAMRYRPYWKGGGGITVSGGEPLWQIDFVTDLFKQAKANGVSTCIDTAGAPFTYDEPYFSKLSELLKLTDLLLLDIKHIAEVKHQELTGQSNANILEFARFLAKINKPVWIRHVLVPTINDDEASLQKLSDFIASLGNVKRVEVLPYHRLAIHKYEELGIKYRLNDIEEPTKEQVKSAENILRVADYTAYKN